MEGAACPPDGEIARACGSRSPGRARRLVAYMETRNIVVTRNDPRGLRIIALPDLGWETAPGDPKASEEEPVVPEPRTFLRRGESASGHSSSSDRDTAPCFQIRGDRSRSISQSRRIATVETRVLHHSPSPSDFEATTMSSSHVRFETRIDLRKQPPEPPATLRGFYWHYIRQAKGLFPRSSPSVSCSPSSRP